MGRYEDTAALLQSVSNTSAADPVYLLLHAGALINDNRRKKALPFLQQALTARADFPEATATLASLQIDLGQVPKGIEMVKTAPAARGNSPDLHNSFGLLLGAQSKFAEAEVEYEKALALRPNFPDAMINHAIALARQNRASDAIPELQKALSVNPKNLKGQANLAVTFLSARR